MKDVERIQPLRIDIDHEEDGRFLGSVPDLPGVMAYGDTVEEATRKVKSIALQVLADMIDRRRGSPPPRFSSGSRGKFAEA
jgi:predicted RNase H-like HicB family nuclease